MNFSKSKIFLFVCLSFIFGVLIAPFIPKIFTVIAAVFFVILISVWWNSKMARIAGVCGLVLLAGVMRFQTAILVNNLTPFYDTNLKVSGVIIEEPDIRDDKIYLTLGKIRINDQEIQDKILVSVYPNHNFDYGDELELSGKIQEPAVFEDFNYRNYLSRYGIHAVMYYPNFEVSAQNRGNPIKSQLLSIKHKFITNLTTVLPEPQNALLGGILVGEKRTIPKDLSDKFNTTGTSHIVAISGYNITIIVWALDLMLRRFGKKVSSSISFLLIIAFVILTGAAASAIRAAIIGTLGLIALNIGRLQNITNAMALTGAAMVLLNPKILHFDVGFQLSFLALCGLVYLTPIISWRHKWIPDWVSRGFTATLAAQIFTLPILLYNFDRLSLVSPLTNVLVLEMVPPTMALGFGTGVLGFIWPALASLVAWPLWILLSYIIEIVQLTARIPYASIGLHINIIGLLIYYAALIIVVGYGRKRRGLQSSGF
ncbi:MAG: ComEC family competence protein [Candidatus Doudnabacteria bacterium]|nr:ComEC family competence protein [Candidatus Doudnabacteria bacterium]